MNLWIWLRSEWDRVAGFALVGLGAVFLLLGYLGVKNSPFVAEQLAYIASGGLGGIFCLGIGVGLLLSADLHDEWRKLDRIESAMRGEPLPAASDLLDLSRERGTVAASGPAVPVAAGERLLVGHAPVLALDWRADGLRRALGLSGAVLLAPLAVMGVGFRTANHTSSLGTAARGVGIGVLGLAGALAVVGVYTFWIRARTVSRKQRLFGPQLLLDELSERVRHQPRPASSTAAADDTHVVVAAGSRRYHRPGCASLAGLETTAVDRRSVDPGLAPCGLCSAP
jgi:hypothetical protein